MSFFGVPIQVLNLVCMYKVYGSSLSILEMNILVVVMVI